MNPRTRPRIRPSIKLLSLLALAVAAAALFFADVIPGCAMTNTAIIETSIKSHNQLNPIP
jgi:hypothetical protein